MSTGSIWVKECTHTDDDVSNENEKSEECFLVHGMKNEVNETAGAIRLRQGEIAVIGCVTSRLLPLVNLNERTPDIRLATGEFATIRCRNAFGQITDSIDVFCDVPVRRVAVRDLRVSQFVVVTCGSLLAEMSNEDQVEEPDTAEE